MNKEILFFSANWCTACNAMAPIAGEVAKQNGIPFKKIDTDYDASLVSKYNIRSIPTAVLLENGNEIKRTVGASTSTQFDSFLKG